MQTKDQVLELIEKSKHIKVGVSGGGGDICYFSITRDEAVRQADLIAGFDLVAEFGHEYMSDTLYIESKRRSRG